MRVILILLITTTLCFQSFYSLLLIESIALARFSTVSFLVFSSLFVSTTGDSENFYKTLGLKKDASNEEIKKKYRTLAKQYHPDKNPQDRETAEKKFIEISEAYEVLGDPQKKREYDEEISMQNRFGHQNAQGFHSFGQRNRAQQWRSQRDPFEFFNQQFNEQQQQRQRQQQQTTTYYFQGPDGRVYMRTVYNNAGQQQQQQQQGFHYEFNSAQHPIISLFLNYLLVPMLPLLLILFCNCCCPAADEGDERRGQRQQQRPAGPARDDDQQHAQGAEERPAGLPLVHNRFLLRRGVICVVSLREELVPLLEYLRQHSFRNDPFLFCRLPTSSSAALPADHRGDELEALEAVLQLTPEADLLAVTRNGRRFAVFSLADSEGESVAAGAGLGGESKDENDRMARGRARLLAVRKWLEKCLDGSVGWSSIE